MAMDYEFHILMAEKELAHLREMQALTRPHVEAHDNSLKAADGRFERIDGYLEQIAANQARTEANLARTDIQLATLAERFNSLIDALTRERGNGDGKQ
jgi:chromosome segregation ATPase